MTIDLRYGHFTHSDFPRQYSSPGQALSLCTAVTRRPVCVSLSHSCCLYVPCRLYQDNICSLIFRYEGLSQQQSVCPPPAAWLDLHCDKKGLKPTACTVWLITPLLCRCIVNGQRLWSLCSVFKLTTHDTHTLKCMSEISLMLIVNDCLMQLLQSMWLLMDQLKGSPPQFMSQRQVYEQKKNQFDGDYMCYTPTWDIDITQDSHLILSA